MRSDRVKATLQPYGLDRLASRLILRPHEWSGQIRAAALVLRHPDPREGYVLDGHSVHHNVDAGKERWGLKTRRTPLERNGTVFPDPISRYLEEIS